MNHADLRKQGHKDHDRKLQHMAGGGHVERGGKAMLERAMREDRKEDAAMVKKAVAQHESHDHPGKSKTKLHLATGGRAEDAKAPARLDRKGLKTGGRAKKGGHTNVNVIVAPGHGGQPMPIPVPMGAGPGGPPPMMPPPGAGGPPPGLGGPPPGMGAMPPRPMPGPPVGAGVPGMGMRARGGRAGYKAGGAVDGDQENKPATGKGRGDQVGGAGGAEGRLEKIKDYGAMSDKVERKRGGRTGRDMGGAADMKDVAGSAPSSGAPNAPTGPGSASMGKDAPAAAKPIDANSPILGAPHRRGGRA
jgi:hypothetical protein